MAEITVYFQAFPDRPDTGSTTITVPGDDPERQDFLKSCESFFKRNDRPDDAAKFEQAARQSVPESDNDTED